MSLRFIFCAFFICIISVLQSLHSYANDLYDSKKKSSYHELWKDNSLSKLDAKTLRAKDTLKASMHCIQIIKYFEAKYRLPRNLLYAISLVESGRFNTVTKSKLPWPWSLNINGEPRIYSSRREVLSTLKKLLAGGKRIIDIGCAQVNYHYHKTHFPNLENMVNPLHNIAYAAYFLKQKYNEKNHWPSAIAAYHSQNSKLGFFYMLKVLKAWDQLEKLSIGKHSFAFEANHYKHNKGSNTSNNSYLKYINNNKNPLSDKMHETVMVYCK